MKWLPVASLLVLLAAATLVIIDRARSLSVPPHAAPASARAAEVPGAGTADPAVADNAAEGSEQESGDYIVAGRVVDGAGRPVEGAAVHLREGSG